jgi:hypothetical protein
MGLRGPQSHMRPTWTAPLLMPLTTIVAVNPLRAYDSAVTLIGGFPGRCARPVGLGLIMNLRLPACGRNGLPEVTIAPRPSI